MSTLKALEEQFLTSVAPLKGEMAWQQKAWDRFNQCGLPQRDLEAYRYVSLRLLYTAKATFPSCVLPQVPKGVIALPLDKAYSQFRSYLDQHFARWLDEEKDPFTLLGTAVAKEGLFLYLPPNTVIEEPLLLAQPSHLVLYMAKGSSMKLRLMREGSGEGWTQRLFEAGLDENAELSIQLEPHDHETLHLDSVRVSLKRDAKFKSVALPSYSSINRQDYHVKLMGEGADAKLFGLVKSDLDGQQHTHVLMEHLAPHTTSWQQFKAVLGGRMKHSFEGKIYIHSEAQKVDAYQMHKSLILDERAESKSKPNLEIFADDVKASHGATCGQLDEESLFYLTSRGIEKQKARQILIDAFCQEVLDEFIS